MKLSFKFLPLLAFAVFAGFSASALEAKFVSIEGKVEILEGGMWIPVEEGDIIQERGAVISTGFKSNAVVSVKGTNASGQFEIDTDLMKMKHYLSVAAEAVTNEVNSLDFFRKAQEFIEETRNKK